MRRIRLPVSFFFEFAEIAEIRAAILQRMLCFFAGGRYIMIEKGRDCSL